MTPATVVAALAVSAWLVAALSALRLLRYRLPERGAGWYATRGYAFFSAHNFTPEARATHRLFLASSAAFALAVLALIVIAAGRT